MQSSRDFRKKLTQSFKMLEYQDYISKTTLIKTYYYELHIM